MPAPGLFSIENWLTDNDTDTDSMNPENIHTPHMEGFLF